MLSKDITPKEIVSELDKYIIGQGDAKKIVAIAVRNRIRRKKVIENLRDEITPKNILMIGPTGVGKTEIARRLSKLTGAPFIKVEATKYTEVGYVGRDVDSMVRDLVEVAISMVREERTREVLDIAKQRTNNRLLDIMLPPLPSIGRKTPKSVKSNDIANSQAEILLNSEEALPEPDPNEKWMRNREKLKKQMDDGKLEKREVEIEVKAHAPMVEVLSSSGAGMEEIGIDMKNLFEKIIPQKSKTVKMNVSEARKILMDEEVEKLLDMDKIIKEALNLVQDEGIIFIDEFDKVAGRHEKGSGPDVSREGVQRDILPIVEGSTVYTKYGFVSTDHILFIAAGAFTVSKPSDLIPELQGRFPLRAELKSLSVDEFQKILTEPENAIIKQYRALLETENVTLIFTEDAILEIAQSAYEVNTRIENIGARRLHTILEKLLEDILFKAPDCEKEIIIDKEYVRNQLKEIIKDRDLSKFIL